MMKLATGLILGMALTLSTFAAGPEPLVAFDFEGGLTPSAGTAKDKVRVSFKRSTSAVRPGNVAFEANKPCIEDGLKGKGLFVGSRVENLLSAALSDASGEEALAGIAAKEGCKVALKQGDALFGESCFSVQASNVIRGGVTIPLKVKGGLYRKRDFIYVFSAYIKGEGKVELAINNPTGKAPKPMLVTLTGKWQRVTGWINAGKATEASVSLGNLTGLKCDFLLDGLQLEKASNSLALSIVNGKVTQPTGGVDPSAGPWVRGGTKRMSDVFQVLWQDDALFPVAAGSYNLWIKPEFNWPEGFNRRLMRRNARSSDFHINQSGRLGFLARVREPKSRIHYIKDLPPKGFNPKGWHMLTATWDQAAGVTTLYLDGKKLVSGKGVDQGKKTKNRLQFVSNALIDNVALYGSALTAADVQALYDADKPKEGAE
jgi:Concanavalin A-like lectin/glucanases superfamily